MSDHVQGARENPVRECAALVMGMVVDDRPLDEVTERIDHFVQAYAAERVKALTDEGEFLYAILLEHGKWECGHVSEGTGDEPDQCRICAEIACATTSDARLTALVAALERYGAHHDYSCRLYVCDEGDPCSCGYSDALLAAHGAT